MNLMIYPINCVDTGTNSANRMAGKTTGNSVQIKAVVTSILKLISLSVDAHR